MKSSVYLRLTAVKERLKNRLSHGKISYFSWKVDSIDKVNEII